jgi:tetratricopeptide (TPR) repeat protein
MRRSANVPSLTAIAFAVLVCMSATAIAAGGGSMTSPDRQMRKPDSELAVDQYNAGLKFRDKAWEFQRLADQEGESEKSRNRYLGKAEKEFRKAIKRYRRAIRYEPDLYQAHGSLGYALKQTGSVGDAMAAYDTALTLKPQYTPAIEYRAEAYLANGRYDEVKSAYRDLVKMDPVLAKSLLTSVSRWVDAPETEADAAREMTVWLHQQTSENQDRTP